MRKTGIIFLFLMMLTVFSFSFVSHANSGQPKNFRILYMSDTGKELEHEDFDVYAVQQIFLDKLNIPHYIDPEGNEYDTVGYRFMSWSGRDFEGTASEDKTLGYYGVVEELRRIYASPEPPLSMQATIVLHANGAKYSASNLVRVLWLNQNSDLVREVQYTIGRGESYTDEVPEGYEITSVKAFMMDIWKINNETTIDPEHPSVTYNKLGEEYTIVYRMNLTAEQEAEIRGTSPETTVAETSSVPETTAPQTGEETEPSSETALSTEETASKAYPAAEAQESELTVPETTKADESYSGGSNRVTLILGCVIAVAVIYLVIISIGISSSKNRKNKKKRL